MTAYLFDTSVFSYFLTKHPFADDYYPYLRKSDEPFISFATEAELWYGAMKADWGDRRQNKLKEAMSCYSILPVAKPMAYLFAKTTHKLKSAGVAISVNDVWIAVTAIAYCMPLVTHDRDFLYKKIDGLTVISHTKRS